MCVPTAGFANFAGQPPCDSQPPPLQVGDRHIRALLVHSAEYGVRDELVEASVAAFFTVYYTPGHSLQRKVALAVLEGYLEPKALLKVHYEGVGDQGCEGHFPLVVPQPRGHGKPSFLVTHPEAASLRRRTIAGLLVVELGLSSQDEARIAGAADAAAAEHLARSMGRTVKSLPSVDVTFSVERMPL